MKSKKLFYIICFTFLGLMLGFLLHALIEYPVLYLLVSDFKKYSLGLGWQTWVLIHNVGTPLLTVIGGIVGYRQGAFWWRKLYVETHHTW